MIKTKNIRDLQKARFLEELKKIKITPEILNQKTGVSYKTCQRYFESKNMPSTINMHKIILAFPQINLVWIVMGEFKEKTIED